MLFKGCTQCRANGNPRENREADHSGRPFYSINENMAKEADAFITVTRKVTCKTVKAFT